MTVGRSARAISVWLLVVAAGLGGCLGGKDAAQPRSTDASSDSLPVETSRPPLHTQSPVGSLTPLPVATSAATATPPPAVDVVGDENPPVLSLVSHMDVSSRGATILWKVEDEGAASSWVHYSTDFSKLEQNKGENSALVKGAGEREARLSGLLPERIYYYKVCGRDDAGNIAACVGQNQFQTVEGTSESQAPRISQVNVSEIGASQATFTWRLEDGSASVRSRVEYSSNPSVGYDQSVELSGTGDKLLALSGLMPGTLYHYRVFAVNSLDQVHRSPLPTATFETRPRPDTSPPTHEGVQILSVAYNAVTISFVARDDAGAPVVGIDWMGGTDPNAGWYLGTRYTIASGARTNYVISDLASDTDYVFRIFVTDGPNGPNPRYFDRDAQGTPYAFRTLPEPLPVIDPIEIKVRRAFTTNFTVTYAVTGPSSTSSWVEYGVTSTYGKKSALASPPGPGAKSILVAGLNEATLYHFRIVAESGAGKVNSTDRHVWTSQFAFVQALSGGFTVTQINTSYLRGLDVVFQNSDSTDGILHTWTVYAQAVDTGTAEFGQIKRFREPIRLLPGTYTYYCRVDGHYPTWSGVLQVRDLASQDLSRNVPKTLLVGSNSFTNGGVIPDDHSCRGSNVSPNVTIANVPAKAKTFAVVMEDMDTDIDALAGAPWIHWMAFNIPVAQRNLDSGVDIEALGGSEGANSWGSQVNGGRWYRGPCPPGGQTHTYALKVFALDAAIDVPSGAGASDVLSAMDGHLLAWGEIRGTFSA